MKRGHGYLLIFDDKEAEWIRLSAKNPGEAYLEALLKVAEHGGGEIEDWEFALTEKDEAWRMRFLKGGPAEEEWERADVYLGPTSGPITSYVVWVWR